MSGRPVTPAAVPALGWLQVTWRIALASHAVCCHCTADSSSAVLIHDHHWETVELCGSMLTLACAYAVLSGGRGICRLLRDRLHDISAWTTPAWCIAYLATIDSDTVWGQTAGVPRSPHAEHLEPADETPDIAYEPDGDDGDFGPSGQNFNGGISADARAVLQSIGEPVLNLAE